MRAAVIKVIIMKVADEDDRSSTNDNKDSERNSDGGVWGERGKREAKKGDREKREPSPNPNPNPSLFFASLPSPFPI